MIKEISTRWDTIVVEGMGGEKDSNICAVMEMVVDNEGKQQYLTLEWIESVASKIVFEVTNVSIMDMLLFRAGSPQELQAARDDAPEQPYFYSFIPYEGAYDAQYRSMRDQIKEIIVKNTDYDPEASGGWAF